MKLRSERSEIIAPSETWGKRHTPLNPKGVECEVFR
jgi:hypothetical protein